MDFITPQTQIAGPLIGRPHLVIVGAGASVAAMPEGDRYGRRLPVMATLSSCLGLDGLFEQHELEISEGDFEAVYSSLCDSGSHPDLVSSLEAKVYEYFASLELPEAPTIYDHLVLALRKKDAIATFNWDPFLWQALQRNHGVVGLPRAFFLHGNVAIGSCDADRIMGDRRGRCGGCGLPFSESRLLYPVTSKDYASDPLLEAQWSGFEAYLKSAYVLTIFGYGAPKTDAKAIDVMEAAWHRNGEPEFEEVEIIDIRPDQELRASWDRFVVGSHYRIVSSFDRSTLGCWPRRSCEAIYRQTMALQCPAEHERPDPSTLSELQDWYRTFGTYEQ